MGRNRRLTATARGSHVYSSPCFLRLQLDLVHESSFDAPESDLSR